MSSPVRCEVKRKGPAHRWNLAARSTLTAAWIGRYRRLSKDYEGLLSASENVIYAAAILLLIHRVARA